MKWILSAIALLGPAYVNALGKDISSRGAACDSSYNGKFQVTIGKVNKRDIEKRSCDNPDALLLTLDGGVLKDAKGRTGYIASNFQFQFDEPPQAGAIVTNGFSACGGSLALRGSTIFYQCLSGSFFNLYDRRWAAQCNQVEILILPCSGGSTGGSGDNKGNGGSGGSGGEVTVGTKVVQTTIVTAIADGQPQVHTTTVAIPICQIGDGQIQGHTTPCSSGSPVSQISDGQPQAPPVTQISDGQIRVPPVTQISDGQVQAPPVTQISDGQPQAPPVTQISDGQPQAPTNPPKPESPPITQIPDGQPQAPAGTASSASRPPTPPPTQPPISGGSKVLPGISVALVIALVGIVAL